MLFFLSPSGTRSHFPPLPQAQHPRPITNDKQQRLIIIILLIIPAVRALLADRDLDALRGVALAQSRAVAHAREFLCRKDLERLAEDRRQDRSLACVDACAAAGAGGRSRGKRRGEADVYEGELESGGLLVCRLAGVMLGREELGGEGEVSGNGMG